MLNKKWVPSALAAIAFLSAWQATEFALDYRAILGSILAALCGYASPKMVKP